MRPRRRSSPPGGTSGACATPIGSMPGFTRCSWACYREARRHRPLRSLDVSVGLLELSEPDRSLDLADRDQLERGFARLDVDQRSILVLHYYVGLRLDEVAQALGHPPAPSDRDSTGRRRRCALRSRRTPAPGIPRREAGMTTNDPRSDRRRRPPHRLVRSGCTDPRARRARRRRACADRSDATATGLAAPRKGSRCNSRCGDRRSANCPILVVLARCRPGVASADRAGKGPALLLGWPGWQRAARMSQRRRTS